MTADNEPPGQPPGTMTVGQIVMLAVGILLLLPGACSLFFIVSLIAEKPSNLSDPYVGMFYGFWLVSFVISAVGVALIWAARKKAREASVTGSQ
ncbi:MAG: hypothetical protein ABWY82_19010 [Tardiphaga sp.]